MSWPPPPDPSAPADPPETIDLREESTPEDPQEEPSADAPGNDDIAGPGDEDDQESEKGKRWSHTLKELPVLIAMALVIAIVIKTFVAQAFYIPSASMFPTLHVGDRVIVEKIGYRFGDPSRGDVVVFERQVFGNDADLPWYDDVRNFARDLLGLPTSAEEDYIKRIVAVAGDVISYKGSPRVLRINGEPVEEPWVRGTDRSSQALIARDCVRLQMDTRRGGCLVPPGKVFVMGDNRANSEDSRVIGPIDVDKIVGRAFAIVWPPSDFGGL